MHWNSYIRFSILFWISTQDYLWLSPITKSCITFSRSLLSTSLHDLKHNAYPLVHFNTHSLRLAHCTFRNQSSTPVQSMLPSEYNQMRCRFSTHWRSQSHLGGKGGSRASSSGEPGSTRGFSHSLHEPETIRDWWTLCHRDSRHIGRNERIWAFFFLHLEVNHISRFLKRLMTMALF